MLVSRDPLSSGETKPPARDRQARKGSSVEAPQNEKAVAPPSDKERSSVEAPQNEKAVARDGLFPSA
jgi:hypothetical protein